MCQDWHHIRKGRNELPLEPRNLVVPSGASKTICKTMVHLAQTMHLSCTDTNPASKRKEVRFHMTHVTYEFHRVHPKRLPSLWYVRRKPCTYLASRLAQYVRKAETIFHLSLVTYWYHRVHPKRFMSLWYMQRKPCTYLAPARFCGRSFDERREITRFGGWR